MDLIATLRKPAIWMILFASLHTLGFSLDVVSAVTDDDEISTYLENEVDPEIADNQKLIDMLNMAPGDQKVIYEWGDGAGIKVDNDYDYQVNNIYTTIGFYFQNTEKSKSVYNYNGCLLYTSPSPRDRQKSRMPSSA